MTTEEFVERYCGTCPDAHRRSPFTTWDGIREAMAEDLKQMISSACKEQRKICAREAYIENDLHSDGCLVNRESILNAPEPTLS